MARLCSAKSSSGSRREFRRRLRCRPRLPTPPDCCGPTIASARSRKARKRRCCRRWQPAAGCAGALLNLGRAPERRARRAQRRSSSRSSQCGRGLCAPMGSDLPTDRGTKAPPTFSDLGLTIVEPNELRFFPEHHEKKIVVIGLSDGNARGDSERVDDLRQRIGMPDHQYISLGCFQLRDQRPEVVARDHFRPDA